MTVALLALLSTPAAIDLEAGYYTLDGLGKRLNAAKVKVKIDGNCASDTYAMRFTHRSWEEIRTALQADQRLNISPDGDGWVIQRDSQTMGIERSSRTKYLDFARSTIYGVFNRAALRCQQIARLPENQRDSNLSQIPMETSTDALSKASNQLIIESAGERNTPYVSIGITSFLCDPKRTSPFATLQRFNMFDARTAFFATGDLGELRMPGTNLAEASVSQQNAFAKSILIASKIPFDPLTMGASLRLVGRLPGNGDMVFSYKVMPLTPNRFELIPPVDKIIDAVSMASLKGRVATTETVAGDLDEMVTMPDRPIRVSEAVLLAADGTKKDLVCYVSAFADLMLMPSPKRSIKRILEDTLANRIDQNAQFISSRERLGIAENKTRGPVLQLPRRFTLAKGGGIFVVRNEYRFLDGLSSSSAIVSPAYSNAVFHGKTPGFAELAKTVSEIRMGSWPNSFFSSNYLDFCNPITFRPVALAYVGSKVFQRAITGLKDGQAISVKLSKLENPARNVLISAMAEESGYTDAVAGIAQDPVIDALAYGRMPGDPEILVERSGNQLNFTIQGPNRIYWMTWAKNVSLN